MRNISFLQWQEASLIINKLIDNKLNTAPQFFKIRTKKYRMSVCHFVHLCVFNLQAEQSTWIFHIYKKLQVVSVSQFVRLCVFNLRFSPFDNKLGPLPSIWNGGFWLVKICAKVSFDGKLVFDLKKNGRRTVIQSVSPSFIHSVSGSFIHSFSCSFNH